MGKKLFYISDWTNVDKKILVASLDFIGRLKDISVGTKVFLKPIFTFPFFKPGVTTPPDLIRAVIEILVDHGALVTIGEGGPSLDVFDLENSFSHHGLYDFKKNMV